jgi:two-component system, OmpR family, sensor kinase
MTVRVRTPLGHLPIRVRLIAWYVVLLAAILVALSAFLLLRLRADLVAGVDGSLDARVAQITLGLQGPGDGEFRDVSNAALAGLPRRESAAQLLSRTGKVLEDSGDVVSGQPMIDLGRVRRMRPGQQLHATFRLGPEHEKFRVLAVGLNRPQGAAVLAVGSSLEDVDESIDRLQLLLLIAIPGALALAGGGGWLLARKALLPVARITSQAGAIGGDRLHDRVTVPPAADELARLAETLNAMLDRIERSVVEQRRLVADASHELRTPLAIMRAELEVGLRGADLPPEAVEVLESSSEEVGRMSRIVDDLLVLAHADEGRLQLAREPLDLGELARTVTGKLRPLAEAKRIELSSEGGAGDVAADRARIAQVVANLLDNAVKYTEPGGVVRVAVWEEGHEGLLSVADTGPGIAPAVLPRVFDRFFRFDAARSRAQGGSGLGLAICKEIVEAHGGRIWAESRPDAGSSFTFALPRHPDQPGARRPSTASRAPAPRPGRRSGTAGR